MTPKIDFLIEKSISRFKKTGKNLEKSGGETRNPQPETRNHGGGRPRRPFSAALKSAKPRPRTHIGYPEGDTDLILRPSESTIDFLLVFKGFGSLSRVKMKVLDENKGFI